MYLKKKNEVKISGNFVSSASLFLHALEEEEEATFDVFMKEERQHNCATIHLQLCHFQNALNEVESCVNSSSGMPTFDVLLKD